MMESSKKSAESFMEEFIGEVEARFRIMKKYSEDEGISLIPVEILEKSPRFVDFVCNFSIGAVTRKWASLKRNKESCAEFLETRKALFGEGASDLSKEERNNLWKKFLCLRYKTLLETPIEWRKKQAFAFYNEWVIQKATTKYFRKYAEQDAALYTKYQQKEAVGGKPFQKWLSYVYKMKVPERIKNETKSDILNKLFLHYRQARTKLANYDENIGFTAPLDGYCLRAISEILYKQAKSHGIAKNLPKEDILPEIFVDELKNNEKTKKHLYRCDDNTSFDDLVAGGLKKGAMVFLVEDEEIGHTMFWTGAKDKSGAAVLIGFNNEEEGKNISKTASGKNQHLWVLDVYGFAEQEFLSKQRKAEERTISVPLFSFGSIYATQTDR